MWDVLGSVGSTLLTTGEGVEIVKSVETAAGSLGESVEIVKDETCVPKVTRVKDVGLLYQCVADPLSYFIVHTS